MSLLCTLWPFVAGALFAWILCGFLARRLKNCQTTIEKPVEKQVTVEKLIDNPEHMQKVIRLKSELKRYQQGSSLDLVAARAAGIKIKQEDDFTAIEGIGPKINDLLHADGIHTFKQLSETTSSHIQTILEKAGPRYQMANPGTWPDQAFLAANNRWQALKALQDILDGGVYPQSGSIEKVALEPKSKKNQTPQASVKPAITPAVKTVTTGNQTGDSHDDFTVVEGIGPKINALLHSDNIHTYRELAETAVSRIQEILDHAGPHYRLARPDTWPAQAALAATGSWEKLKQWQQKLDGGKE